MKWLKRGLVWCPDKSKSWAVSHAMCPTPIIINDDVIRVYITVLDAKGRGHVTCVDVSAWDPLKILEVPEFTSLVPGEPGTFDDNGVVALAVVRHNGNYLMYYSGFEICNNVRYRIFTGLAVSEDGLQFERYSSTPVLDRASKEKYFRCGPFVDVEGGKFKLWYVGGDSWTEIDGKSMPVYDLRFAVSPDGKNWPSEGRVVMSITDADEHGFGRPWIVRRGAADYRMYYSVRRRSLKAYRLGYAESTDGVNWLRKDSEIGLDVTPGSFDSDAIMYSAVITCHGKTYCFYNGNNFGEDGFALAELIE